MCYFDVASQKAYVGSVTDSQLRTLMTQVRPVEIIVERNQLPADLIKMFKNQPNNPTLTVQSPEKALSVTKAAEMLESVDQKDEFITELRDINASDGKLKTFAMMVWFLRESLIDQNLALYRFKPIPDARHQQKRLILDSQAIEHLELIGSKQSLLSYVDQCKTKFGKRLMRQWLISPLTNI